MNQPNYLKDLNKEQLAAVTSPLGPTLVLAGAGSGKTRTIIHRLAYLIDSLSVKPEQIIAVTFTNKAAQEMKVRTADLLSKTVLGKGLLIGTFHSISARFLRRHASLLDYSNKFSIYDQADQLSLIRSILKDLSWSPRQVSPGAVLANISRAKADLITPIDYQEVKVNDQFSKMVSQVYVLYQTALKKNQAMDFDDLLSQQVYLWQNHPALLKKYQTTWPYILVDEYQDTNRAQYVWTKLLAGNQANLYAVGDDWQSIYSWRGADFGNILRFQKDYPTAKTYKLEQNYRSSQSIISLSNSVMVKAENKSDKKLWTKNNLGRPVQIVELYDESVEADWVTGEIIGLSNQQESLKEKNNQVELTYLSGDSDDSLSKVSQGWRYYGTGQELSGLAILYRTNAQSRALEEACLKKGLPYHLVGGVRFYERREVKDILSYLRLLLNPWDSASWQRAILSPSRGLGLATIDKVVVTAQDKKISLLDKSLLEQLNLPTSKKQLVVEFMDLYQRWLNILPGISVEKLIDEVTVRSGLKKQLLDGTSEGEARFENIEELKTVATERAPGQGMEALEKFLTDVALWQDQDKLTASQGGLTLMTLHSAKGLEFDTVFLTGLEEGLFPHSSSFNDPKELEEERRLCYVGLTRARKMVYCTYTTNRRLFGSVMVGLPSRFLNDFPKELVEFNLPSPF
ncbi:UvrD-helicase domain-containing protein [Patescibacteria group bacterium]|nr:UvrD-helicase domain-containing protein [Patescibacteria group bacterium]